MQLMSKTDVTALIDLLFEELPTRVLRAVSSGSHSGMTEGEIIRVIERGIPRCKDALDLQVRIRASLEWMLTHGHIDSAGSHRFVRVPPYAIHHTTETEISIQLFGDDCLDNEITRVTGEVGCTIRREPEVGSFIGSMAGLPFVPGIRRAITAPARLRNELLKRLESMGVSHQDIVDLEHTLPSIDGLVMLPEQSYVSNPPSWGIWYRYDSHLPAGKRWAQVSAWESVAPGLLRWVQSSDRRGYFYSRYFWHDSRPKLAELSRSFALLWTYRFDKEDGRAAEVWVDGNELWLPLEVPPEHQQWLSLISTRVERAYPSTHYTLNRPATYVGERLHKSLGVSVLVKRP